MQLIRTLINNLWPRCSHGKNLPLQSQRLIPGLSVAVWENESIETGESRDPYQLRYRLRSCTVPDILIKIAIFSVILLEFGAIVFFSGDGCLLILHLSMGLRAWCQTVTSMLEIPEIN